MIKIAKLKGLKVAVIVPGQRNKNRADIRSLRDDLALADVLNRQRSATESILGPEVTQTVYTATPKKLGENTLYAQLAEHIDTTAMFLGLLSSTAANGATLEDYLKNYLISFLIAGDSCGVITAGYLPNPGEPLEDKITRYVQGLVPMKKRGTLMLNTPHTGGMHAVTRLDLKKCKSLCKNCNGWYEELHDREPKYNIKVVRSYSPTLHAVAGEKELLEKMNELVRQAGGRLIPVSDGIMFHHYKAMQSVRKGLKEFFENHTIPPTNYHYVSTTRDISTIRKWWHSRIADDIIKSVTRPVRIFEKSGYSLVGYLQSKGVEDAIVFTEEFEKWLSGGNYGVNSGIKPYLVTDLTSLVRVRDALMEKAYAEATKYGAVPLPQPSHMPLYQDGN